MKKVGRRFPFSRPISAPPHRKKPTFLAAFYSWCSWTFWKVSRIHARKGLWRPGKAPLPAQEGKDTPIRERPLAAPKTSKNADIKKGFVGIVWAAQSVQKRAHKKDFVTHGIPPTLWRPRETPQGPAGGSVSNSGGVIGQGEPLPLQKEKGRGTMSTTPWGLPLCFGLAAGARAFPYATKLRLDARRGIARCTRSPLQEDREVVAACTKL